MRRFELTADHLKLLRNANWFWSNVEYGAPAMNDKRPYSNSDVTGDINDLLRWGIFPDPDKGYPTQIRELAKKIHMQLLLAIEVIFQSQSFEIGWYVQVDNCHFWKKEQTTDGKETRKSEP